jgi:hypothetical protein
MLCSCQTESRSNVPKLHLFAHGPSGLKLIVTIRSISTTARTAPVFLATHVSRVHLLT